MAKSAQKDFTGVRAKLAQAKDERGAEMRRETLPKSGVAVTFPNHINHRAWMIAQKQAKGDPGKAQAALIAATVRFEGEQLTLADMIELVDARDMLFLVGEIFGDEDDADEGAAGGNAPAAA